MKETVRIVVKGKDRGASKALKNVAKAATKTDKSFDGLAKVMGGLKKAGTTAIAGIAGLGAAFVSVVTGATMSAAQIEGARKSFEGMYGASSKLAEELVEASGHTIRLGDAFEVLNEAGSLVTKQFAQELPEAMQYIQRYATATGKDVTALLEDYTTGVARLSEKILDNIGITIDGAQVEAEYAASIGKTVDALSTEEKQAAWTAESLDQLRHNTRNMADANTTLAGKISAVKNILLDTGQAIGQYFLPAGRALMDTLRSIALAFQDAITSEGPFRDFLLEIAGAAWALADMGEGAAVGAQNIMDVIGQLGQWIIDQAQAIISWGYGIAHWLAQGIAQGIEVIAEVLGAIGDMIAHFLQPSSPPKIAPNIDQWGQETMEEYLAGFGNADFNILNSLTSRLTQVFDRLYEDNDALGLSAQFKQLVAAALAGEEEWSTVFDRLSEYAGDYADELTDLVKQYQDLAEAQIAQASAQEDLAAAEALLSRRQQETKEAQKEYEDAMAAGLGRAKVSDLKSQYEQAKQREKAAGTERDAAQETLDAANEQVALAQDAISLQEQTLDVLLSVRDAIEDIDIPEYDPPDYDPGDYTPPTSGGGGGAGGGGMTMPDLGEITLGDIDLGDIEMPDWFGELEDIKAEWKAWWQELTGAEADPLEGPLNSLPEPGFFKKLDANFKGFWKGLIKGFAESNGGAKKFVKHLWKIYDGIMWVRKKAFVPLGDFIKKQWRKIFGDAFSDASLGEVAGLVVGWFMGAVVDPIWQTMLGLGEIFTADTIWGVLKGIGRIVFQVLLFGALNWLLDVGVPLLRKKVTKILGKWGDDIGKWASNNLFKNVNFGSFFDDFFNMTSLGRMLKKVGSFISNKLKALDFASAMRSVTGKIRGGLDEALAPHQLQNLGIFGRLAGAFSEGISSSWDTVASFVVNKAKTKVPTFLKKVGTIIVTNVETILARGVWAGIKKALRDLWAKITGKGETEAEETGKKSMNKMIDAGKKKLKTRVIEWLNMMSTKLQEGLQAKATWLVNRGIWIIKKIKEGFTQVLWKIYDAGKTFISRLIEGAKQKAENLKSTGTWIVNKIKEGFISLVGKGRALADNVVSGLNDKKTKLKNKGKWVVNRIKSGVTDNIQKARDAGKDICGRILDNIGGFFGRGQDIVTGLVNGVADKISWAQGRFASLFSSLRDVLDGIFDFGSPSKEMFKRGSWMVEGFVSGMASQDRDLERAMATFNPGSEQVPQRVSGDTRNVYIYGGLTLQGVQDKEGLLAELSAIA